MKISNCGSQLPVKLGKLYTKRRQYESNDGRFIGIETSDEIKAIAKIYDYPAELLFQKSQKQKQVYMNNAQLEKALELNEKINDTKSAILCFEKADNGAEINLKYSHNRYTTEADVLDFKEVKALVLKSYYRKLKRLEKEFAAL